MIDASVFRTEPTAAQDEGLDTPPLPNPPEFARIIPISAIEAAKQQQYAEEWGQAQQQKIADLWGQYAQDDLDATVKRYTQVSDWQTPEPTTYEPVQMVRQVSGPDGTAMADVGPAQAPAPPAEQPLKPEDASFGQQLLETLRQAMSHGASGAGVLPVNPEKPPENVGEAALQAAQAEAQREKPLMGPGGPTMYNPNTPVPGGEAAASGQEAPAAARLAKGAGEEAAQAVAKGAEEVVGKVAERDKDLVAALKIADAWDKAFEAAGGWANAEVAGEAADRAVPQVIALRNDEALMQRVVRARSTAADPLITEGIPASTVSAGAPTGKDGATAVPLEELTADHPIVQSVAQAMEQAGSPVDPKAVAKLLQSKGFSPENMAKNTSRLGNTQKAALTAYKAAQDPEIASAIMKSADEELFAPRGASGGPEMATPSSGEPGAENLGKAGQTELPDERAPYTGAGESQLAQNPAIKGINAVQGVLKQAVLGGSVFHPMVETAQLGRTALAEGAPVRGAAGIAASWRAFANSPFAQRYAAENADVVKRAEDAGATMMRVGGDVNPDVQKMGNDIARTLLSSAGGAVTGYASAKKQGQSDEDALKRAAIFAAGGAGVGKLAPALNSAMWGRMVPVAKTEAYKILEPQYGAEVAAKRVNDIFGGQNLAKLGRNPEVQTILRTTFLAPDWLESWAHNMGAAVKPGPEGDAARKYWAATGISAVLTLEGLNMAINGGQTTAANEPGRQLQLEITPIVRAMGGDPNQRYYADMLELGPLGSVLQAGARGAAKGDVAGEVGKNLAEGHLNTAPDIALSAVQNFAPTGGQIVSEGTPAGQAAIPEIAAAAGHVAPIGASTFEKGDVPVPAAAGSAFTGVRISTGPAVKAKAASGGLSARSSSTRGQNNLSGLSSAGKGTSFGAAFGAGNPTSGRNNLKGLSGR